MYIAGYNLWKAEFVIIRFFASKNQVLENHKNMGVRPTMFLEHHENMGARLTMYQLLSGSRIPINVQNCIGFPHFLTEADDQILRPTH